MLEKVSLFQNIPTERLKLLLESASTAIVRGGTSIFHEGEVGADAIFVARGLVSLSKQVPPERRVTVELVGSGEPLGVAAVIDDRPFPLQATAFIETSLLFIPKSNFLELARSYPNILPDLYKVVGARFRKAQERIAHLVSAGARERVVEALRMLLERPEVCAEQNTVLTSRKQLAEIAGVTTETCIRMTSALENEKVLTFPGRKSIRVDTLLLNQALETNLQRA